ncbi:MAG: hypothetical protein AB7D40_08225 [Bacteroidales bacterium]
MDLVIADYRIRLQSDTTLFLDSGHLPYVQTDAAQEADLFVEIREGLPMELLDHKHCLFTAEDDQQRMYRIFEDDAQLLFQLYNQDQPGTTQQIALLDETRTNWTVYTQTRAQGLLHPFKFPFTPILLYQLVVHKGGLLIHASGIYDPEANKGRLFTGFSGYGKSTMAGLWTDAGCRTINDDRLILRKQDNAYYMHNTPMYYPDEPKKTQLHDIHLIRHASENDSRPLQGIQALSRVMAFCIQNNHSAAQVQAYIRFIQEMLTQVRVFETGFLPQPSILEHIRSHD